MKLACRDLLIACVTLLVVSRGPITWPAAAEESPTAAAGVDRSPVAMALSSDGKTLYAADRTAGNVTVLDRNARTKRGEIAVEGQPAQLVLSSDDGTLYVAQRGAGTVAAFDTKTFALSARFPVGRWPRALALAEKSKRLFVANQDSDDISVVDLSLPPGAPTARIAVVREPSDLALSPDENWLVVANELPRGTANDEDLAAHVSVIDCRRLVVAADVPLPTGSTAVHGVCLSPDGKWAYVVHHLGRFNLPITHSPSVWWPRKARRRFAASER